MYNPSTDILGKNVSRYTLVSVVAKRARQIVDGSLVKVEGHENENPITAALEEVRNGKIEYKEKD